MTPLQVQFCFQIAVGNEIFANNLLSDMSENNGLLVENEWGCSPLSFCLWAARQPNHQDVLNTLNRLFPDITQFLIEENSNIFAPSATIEDTVRSVIVPVLKMPGILVNFLSKIVKRILNNKDSDDTIYQMDVKSRFDLQACRAALSFIMAEPEFIGIESSKKVVILKLFSELTRIDPEHGEVLEIHESNAPSSVRKHREVPALGSFRYAGLVDLGDNLNAYLPSGGAYSNSPTLYAHTPRAPRVVQDMLANNGKSRLKNA